jgi:hypothetical protein
LRELVDGHFFGEAASEDSDDASLQALAEFYCGKADPQTMELLQSASAARSGSSTYWMQLDSKMVVKRRMLSQGMSDINNIARDWELPSFS